MANKKITVFEYSKLNVGDQDLKDHHFKSLVKLNEMNGGKYFTIGYNRITFKSFVGVIQVGDIIIEILPKADHSETIDESKIIKWQRVLLEMLKKAGLIKLYEHDNAAQQTKNLNLLDVFIFTFLKEVNELIHAGLVKKYRRSRSNQSALKGRLIIEKNILYNYVHKERFYTEHTVYDRDNQLNSLLKRALEIIKATTSNATIKGDANNALLYFENINSWIGNTSVLKSIPYDRKTKHYKNAIELAILIILNYSPDMSAGKNSILSILFDMNKLFEKFIYQTLKSEEVKFKDFGLNVSKQTSRAFWRSKTIRPDIIIEYKKEGFGDDSSITRIVVDTKWKVIDTDNPSDEDLKQMYAYNLQFGANSSILFYPSVGQQNTGKVNYAQSAVAKDFEHGCELYFAELFKADSLILNESFGYDFLSAILNVKTNR